MKNKFNGAHFETEQGFKISKREYKALKLRLPELGFAFSKRAKITDFVIPTRGKVTRRMRIEKIGSGDEAVTRCIRGFKNHPVKGKKGKHVRLEDEKLVKSGAALTFILDAMSRLKAPVPYYTKKRLHFQGKYEDLDFVITLDRAEGTGRYSGRYIEIETLLPLDSTKDDIKNALNVIATLAELLLGEKRKPKISYRKMLMKTWRRKIKTRRKKLKKLKQAKKGKKRKEQDQKRKKIFEKDRSVYTKIMRRVAPKQAKEKKTGPTSNPKETKEQGTS